MSLRRVSPRLGLVESKVSCLETSSLLTSSGFPCDLAGEFRIDCFHKEFIAEFVLQIDVLCIKHDRCKNNWIKVSTCWRRSGGWRPPASRTPPAPSPPCRTSGTAATASPWSCAPPSRRRCPGAAARHPAPACWGSAWGRGTSWSRRPRSWWTEAGTSWPRCPASPPPAPPSAAAAAWSQPASWRKPVCVLYCTVLNWTELNCTVLYCSVV